MAINRASLRDYPMLRLYRFNADKPILLLGYALMCGKLLAILNGQSLDLFFMQVSNH